MTVKKLIEELSKLPSNLIVVGEWESLHIPVRSIHVERIEDEKDELFVILDVNHSLSSPD
jgi:hypothetical protein